VPSRAISARGDGAWLALALVLVAVVYFPITRNFFFADDFLLFYDAMNKRLGEFVFRMYGGHLLILRNGLFVLFNRAFGLNPAPYFWVAFLTHLANVILLFCIVRQLTGSARLGCFGAALWGVLPVHGGPLGWHSVYGQVLGTTLLLGTLLGVSRPAAGDHMRTFTLAWCAALAFMAALCFGVCLAVVLALPAAAFAQLPPSRWRIRTVAAFAGVAVVALVLYFGVPRAYLAAYGVGASFGYAVGGLGDWARYLTFFVHLVGSALATLALGVFDRRAAYPSALGLTGALILAGLIAAALVTARGSVRRSLLAWLIIAAAVYGMIAVGRTILIPPEKAAMMARMDRFHYFGTAALAVIASLALGAIGRGRWAARIPGTALLLTWVGVTAVGYLVAGQRIDGHPMAQRERDQVLTLVHDAVRTADGNGDVYVKNRPFRAMGPILVQAAGVFPGWAGVFAIHYPTGIVDGRRVRFIDDDPRALISTRKGLHTSELLIAPGELPPEAQEVSPR
jgi:hypothetical protein